MRVGGEIGASEGLWYSLMGWRGAMMVLVLAAVTYSALTSPALDNPSATTLVLRYLPLAMIPVAWGYIFWNLRRVRRRAGLPARYHVDYELKPDVLAVTTPVGALEFRWAAIASVTSSGRYWVIQGPGSKPLLPKRFFESPQAERAFVAGIIGHLTPEARRRSAKAEKFAAWE